MHICASPSFLTVTWSQWLRSSMVLVSIVCVSFLYLRMCVLAVTNGPRLHRGQPSELNVDNWNDNCEAKSEAKSPRPLRGLQVDFSLTRIGNVSYAVR